MVKIRSIALSFCFIALFFVGIHAQTVIFAENVGSPSGTTAIGTYTGWQNSSPITFSGTGDVRTSSASSGYTGSSGSGNVFLTNSGTASFEIAGINTSSYGSMSIAFGFYKSTTASDGSELSVEVSSDGVTYVPLTVPARPTGGGTAIWILTSATGAIPVTTNLRIRFTNTGTTPQFRIDDISLKGIVTSAANGTISGKVKNAKGLGLRFCTVMVTGAGLAEPVYATTNMFGYYQFEDLPLGEDYILQVFSGRYTFSDPSRVVNLAQSVSDLDFIGGER